MKQQPVSAGNCQPSPLPRIFFAKTLSDNDLNAMLREISAAIDQGEIQLPHTKRIDLLAVIPADSNQSMGDILEVAVTSLPLDACSSDLEMSLRRLKEDPSAQWAVKMSFE